MGLPTTGAAVCAAAAQGGGGAEGVAAQPRVQLGGALRSGAYEATGGSAGGSGVLLLCYTYTSAGPFSGMLRTS